MYIEYQDMEAGSYRYKIAKVKLKTSLLISYIYEILVKCDAQLLVLVKMLMKGQAFLVVLAKRLAAANLKKPPAPLTTIIYSHS